MFREDERKKGCQRIGQGLSGICSLGLDILQLRSTWKWQKATKRLPHRQSPAQTGALNVIHRG